MSPKLVDQPSAFPTRKLAIASLIGPAMTETWGRVMLDVYPPLGGEALSVLVGAIAALIVGYFVRDRANTT